MKEYDIFSKVLKIHHPWKITDIHYSESGGQLNAIHIHVFYLGVENENHAKFTKRFLNFLGLTCYIHYNYPHSL